MANRGGARIFVQLLVIFLVFLSGGLLARADIYQGIAPFGMALLLAMSGSKYVRIVFLGVCVGAVSLGLSWESLGLNLLPYLLAGGTLFLFQRREPKLFLRRIIGCVCLILPTVFIPVLLYTFIIRLVTALCVFLFIPVCERAVGVLNLDRRVVARDEAFSVVLLLCAALLGIGNASFQGIHLTGVLTAAAAMIAAAALGVSGSTAIGAVMGFFLLSQGELPEYSVALITASMLAGLFGEVSKFGPAAGYLLGNVLVTLVVTGGFDLLIPLPECLIGGLVVLLPKSVAESLKGSGIAIGSTRNGRSARALAFKLSRMSGVFSGLADAYDEACAAISPGAVERLGANAETHVCKDCKQHIYCWQMRRKDTIDDLGKLAMAAVAGEKMENSIPLRCKEPIALVDYIRDSAGGYVRKAIDPQSRIMAGYCRNLERIVHNMAEGARKESEYDTELERAILTELDAAGIAVREVLAVNKGACRITVVKRPCNNARMCERKIQQVLSAACGANIRCVDSGCDAGAYCVSEYEEAVRFSVNTGVARVNKDGSVSGDSVAFAHLPDGRYMLALSDGMGSGEGAKEESETTVTFIESFLASGMDEHTCLDVVNQLLLLRGREDTYSTADIAILELNVGIGTFLKIGACTGMIKHGNTVEKVEAGSLPIGIIEGVVPEVSSRLLHDGDMIVMVSDGILDAYDMEMDKLALEVAGINIRNPQEFADALLKKAVDIVQTPRDDMTVLAARVWEGRLG